MSSKRQNNALLQSEGKQHYLMKTYQHVGSILGGKNNTAAAALSPLSVFPVTVQHCNTNATKAGVHHSWIGPMAQYVP